MNIFKNLIVSNPYYVLAYLTTGFVIFIYPMKEAIENIYYRANHEMIIAIGGNFSKKDRILTPIAYIFCFLLFVVIWPIPAAFLLHQFCKSKKDEAIFKESRFYCRTEYIGDKFDPIAAEKNHQIYDPLGLTPNTPFGHLYGAWREFLAEFDTNDALLYFEIPSGSKAGFYNSIAKCAVKGYARVNSGKILGEFIFEGE